MCCGNTLQWISRQFEKVHIIAIVLMDRAKKLCRAVSDLKSDEILDVTSITSKLCCFIVKGIKDILKAKYILSDHKVVADTYTSIAEAAYILPNAPSGEDSDIYSVRIVRSLIHLRRISPLSEDVPIKRCKRTECDNSKLSRRSSASPTAKSPCFMHAHRAVPHPKWLRKLELTGRLNIRP